MGRCLTARWSPFRCVAAPICGRVFCGTLRKIEMSPVPPQMGDHMLRAVAVTHPCDAGADPFRTRNMPDVSRSA